MRKFCDFNMSWIMSIHLLTRCMSNSCPPLPTSFHRVSAVLIFRWYSHNWVGLEGRDRKPGAWYTWKVQKVGDATEENWAWWEHCYLFNTINTGSLNLLPLPSLSPHLPLPLFPLPTPHSPLHGRFWQLLKSSPSNHTISLFWFTLLSGCQAWIWEALSRYTYKALSEIVPIKSSLCIPMTCVSMYSISLIPRPAWVWG